MVAAGKLTGALQRQQVAGIGHHADHANVPLGVAADVANRIGREVAAALALAYLLARCQEGIGKGAALLLGLAQ